MNALMLENQNHNLIPETRILFVEREALDAVSDSFGYQPHPLMRNVINGHGVILNGYEVPADEYASLMQNLQAYGFYTDVPERLSR